MLSKLSRYCDGIMEASWLAAIILAPLFFNTYSSRIFEPDKITLVRTLALLVLAAWGVKLLEEGRLRWETIELQEPKWRAFLRLPLAAPVSLLAVVYILATIFSVTPSVSLWGSYQRLQGTYSTFSYLVIFAAIAANLRQRGQVDRLVTTAILTSLPISLYGVLQRYSLDPIPWGGDVKTRIASNMGNSIFVAAYLIMVFPLAVMRIVESFTGILKETGRLYVQMARATFYVFTASLQIIAIYMSGSRGPVLGLFAGSFFLFLLLSLYWRKRWLTLTTVGVAAALAVFLVIFQIPGGPLESLRKSPAIGRFGLLLDAQSNSALVRKYIWEGTVSLVSPHEPLNYPDGSKDSFNFLRPLIGYGPESMYVAYNPFYVPDLAHVERRNASPDRSHNETWDSIVITGLLGLAAYLALFAAVFYYGFKWLGLLSNRRQAIMFFGLFLGGGGIGALVLSLWRGVAYLGLGLPFGIILGLIGYLALTALMAAFGPTHDEVTGWRRLVIIALLSAIMAHFAEINFGIAIASTRTHFWAYTGMLFVLGFILPKIQETGTRVEESRPILQETERAEKQARRSEKGLAATRAKKRRIAERSVVVRSLPTGKIEAVVGGMLIGLMLAVFGYEFIINRNNSLSELRIVWESFTLIPQGSAVRSSYGILGMILITWIFGSVVMTSEAAKLSEKTSWWKVFGLTLAVSLGIGLVCWLLEAGALTALLRERADTVDAIMRQVGRYEGVLTRFYLLVFLMVLGLGYFLGELAHGDTLRLREVSMRGIVAAPVALVLVIILAAYTNLRIVQADIVFKLTDAFTRSGSWPVAIEIYQRANDLAPSEDFYYLFLGRAYLEYGKTLTDASQREALISQAARDLLLAQSINPLNTDHTANLARLYSLWASYAGSMEDRQKKANTSAEYFEKATILSPNSARIWDEWALLELNIRQNPDEAMRLLNRALEIDPVYDFSLALLGEYFTSQMQQSSDSALIEENRIKGIEAYTQAVANAQDTASWVNYNVALVNLYVNGNQLDDAIRTLQDVLGRSQGSSNEWRYLLTLGQLFFQKQDKGNAIYYATNALNLAPADQQSDIQLFIDQINASP